MANELITVVAPAIRVQWWLQLHEAFTKTNDVKFKMIFVGHIKPEYTLPDNFTHIYSENTAAACAEIGFRNVDTEYVINIADDYDPTPEHFTPHILDKLLEEHKRVESLGVKHFFVGPSFCLGPQEEYKEAIPLVYWNNDHTSPMLTISPLTKIQTNRILGGVDSSFAAMYWDTDLNMRLYQMGGQAKIMGMKFENGFWSENRDSEEFIRVTERDVQECRDVSAKLGTRTLSARHAASDNNVFRGCWDSDLKTVVLDDGRAYVKGCARKHPVVPFGKNLK